MRLLAFLAVIATSVLGQTASTGTYLAPVSASNPGYMLTSFYTRSDNTCGVITQGVSTDPSNFYSAPVSVTSAINSVFQNRDPSFMVSPLDGTFWMTATQCAYGNVYDWQYTQCFMTGNEITSCNALTTVNMRTNGLASSVHVWAPEWFIDPNGSGIGAIHVYLSSSNTVACCSGFQIYETHPTSCTGNDLATCTWSTAALVTVTGEANIIDAYMVCKHSGDAAPCDGDASDTYYLWYNDKSSATGCINYASSSTLTGTYTPVMTDQCFGIANYVEGPSVIRLYNGDWRVYYDAYQNTYNLGQTFFSDSSNNWSSWSNAVAVGAVQQAKHGSVLRWP